MANKQEFFLGGKVRRIDVEKIVLEEEHNVWVNAVNASGETPLHILARHKKLRLVHLVLPYYTNIQAVDELGNTVLHLLADHNVEECEKTRQKRIDLISILISKGESVNKANNYGWTIAHFAAKHCHVDLLKNLKKKSVNFNLRTIADETPLLLACKHMVHLENSPGEIQTIDFLVDHVSEINAVDKDGCSALHYAAERCSSKTISKLLKRGANVHLRTKEHKLTPLHFAAAKERNLPSVVSLVKAGATVKPQDTEELTPLHMSLIGGSLEIVGYLINNGADINRPDKILQFTPLHLAIFQQRRDFLKFLLHIGADVNGKTKDGFTPLHLSSMLGTFEFTNSLINRGADVNCLDSNMLTPLHLAIMRSHLVKNPEIVGADAIRHGHEKSLIVKLATYPYNPIGLDYQAIIQLLLRSGADVNPLTLNGWSPLHFAVKLQTDTNADVSSIKLTDSKSPTHSILDKSNVNYAELHSQSKHTASSDIKLEAVTILIRAGADVNIITQDGKSPLHLALESMRYKFIDEVSIDVIKLLVDHGANVNCMEPYSRSTPLHIAMNLGHNDAAKILINAGADVNAVAPNGVKPIHLASLSDDTEILNILISRGADVNSREIRSQLTPLHLAFNKSHRHAAAILIRAGADVNALTIDGKSPMHLALEIESGLHYHKTIFNMLLQLGAKLNCKKRRCLYTLLYDRAESIDEKVIDQLNESDKTPLFIATAAEENREVKRAIFRLAALVDARNSESCMAVNDRVSFCNAQYAEYHRDCKVNYDDKEASSNFITYLILSGAVYEIRKSLSNNIHHLPKFLSHYKVILDTLKFALKADCKGDDYRMRNYNQHCLDEVKDLKRYSICDGVTLFDMINMAPRRRRFYSKSLDFKHIEFQFNIYYRLILTYSYEDRIRTIILETFYWAFHQLTNFYLPVPCLDEIFWKLGIIDIIAFIEAAEGID